MKRIVMMLTVALVMAVMMMVTATSAFAVSPGYGPCVHPIGPPPQSGGPGNKSLSGCEPFLEHSGGR